MEHTLPRVSVERNLHVIFVIDCIGRCNEHSKFSCLYDIDNKVLFDVLCTVATKYGLIEHCFICKSTLEKTNQTWTIRTRHKTKKNKTKNTHNTICVGYE